MGITQFFISYWWLIAILVILVAIIVRSVLKILISLVIIFIVINIFWQLFIAKGFSASNQCFSDESTKTELFIQQAKEMKPGVDRNKLVCDNDYERFSNLTSCLSQSKKDNPISFILFSSLPKFRTTITATVASHNDKCPETVISVPKF
jgi:hypothetical protein